MRDNFKNKFSRNSENYLEVVDIFGADKCCKWTQASNSVKWQKPQIVPCRGFDQ